MLIALTGSIGSGKSAAAKIFQACGFDVINADNIARSLLENDAKIRLAISDILGKEAFEKDGSPNRKIIAQKIFSDKKLLERVESTMHPAIMKTALEGVNSGVRVVEVPLLFEKKLEGNFDLCIMVYCSDFLRFRRLRIDRGMSDAEIFARDALQMPQKTKAELADVVLFNESGLDFLNRQISLFISRLS